MRWASLVVSPSEINRRTELSTTPASGTNTIVTTHKPNIVDAFGKDWSNLREGEASVFEPDGQGSFKLIVRVPAEEWAKLSSVSD